MKKIVLALFLGTLLVGCKIHETFIITDSEEVNLRYGFDFSPMLKLGTKDKDKKANQKVIDTVLDFKTLLVEHKDSISKLPDSIKAKLEFLSGFDIRLNVDESKDIFLYEMGINISSVAAISKDMSPFKSIDALSKTDKNLALGSSQVGSDSENIEASYSYTDKFFIKTVTSKDKSKKKSKKASKKEKLGDDEFSKQISAALKECSYVMKYTFPKEIKNVSLKGAKISDDRKTFTYEVFLEEMDEQKDLEFKVEFK
ncbi:hypothetical protein ACFSX9_15150 [Flavobacterium ardleyense]|uniref:Lipoprotein n=1 Tax=Flavobacterium ardleyense TaxID=2038737 RepID=A0ABW5ZAZ1_9FLAO